MKCRQRITIAWSVALAGFTVGFMSPAAHGHGNNPRQPDLSDTLIDPEEPSVPWIDRPPREDDPSDPAAETPASSDFVDSSEVMPFLDMGGLLDAPLGELLSQPEALPAPIVPEVNPADLLGGGIDALDVPMSGPVAPPVFNTVPSPGTLALIGLAALAATRRRRR